MPAFRLPVRQLVEFLLRTGSIDSRFTGFDRANEGARIHRKLQKAAGEGYAAEVFLSGEREAAGIPFTIEGRADGIFTDEAGVTVIDEITTTAVPADDIADCTFEGVVTSISSAGTTTGSTTTYPVTIRIDDTGSLMPGMNATAALAIPPCRRYVIVKATAGFAVFRLILKSLLFYSCLDFTQNLGKTHFCLTFGVHFSIRSLFFGIFFNVFAIGIYSFDSCFLSTTWIS